MKFWDSSALVPLVIEERASAGCRDLLREDPAVAVWALTRTEMVSAIRRKERAGELSRGQVQDALGRVTLLEDGWTEVDSLAAVRNRAERLLAVHRLRAADALQLAAVLVLAEEHPRGWVFVTADQRLAIAASAEGLEIQGPAFED